MYQSATSEPSVFLVIVNMHRGWRLGIGGKDSCIHPKQGDIPWPQSWYTLNLDAYSLRTSIVKDHYRSDSVVSFLPVLPILEMYNVTLDSQIFGPSISEIITYHWEPVFDIFTGNRVEGNLLRLSALPKKTNSRNRVDFGIKYPFYLRPRPSESEK